MSEEGCDAPSQIQALRHDAEERDGVTAWGWTRHDGRGFGQQNILDRKMRVNFTTTFIQPHQAQAQAQTEAQAEGDEAAAALHKDRWAMRIEAHPVAATAGGANSRPQTLSLFFYTALADDDTHSVELLNARAGGGGAAGQEMVQRLYAGPEAGHLIVRSGLAPVQPAAKAPPTVRTYFHAARIDTSVPAPPRPGGQQAQPKAQQFTWAAKEIVQGLLSESYRPAWSAYVQRAHQAQRLHEAQPSPRHTTFQPPPPPHFVPTLPNTLQPHANFLVIQHVSGLRYI